MKNLSILGGFIIYFIVVISCKETPFIPVFTPQGEQPIDLSNIRVNQRSVYKNFTNIDPSDIFFQTDDLELTIGENENDMYLKHLVGGTSEYVNFQPNLD